MIKALIPAIFCFVVSSALGQEPINVMTFNIRYDNPDDSLNRWPYRKDNAAGQVLFHEAHIPRVQEALHHQVQDLRCLPLCR